MHKIIAFCIIAFMAVTACPCVEEAKAAAPQVLTENGLETLLQNTGNKIVVLNFFATWCPPCRTEIPNLIRLRARFPKSRVAIMSKSVDDTQETLNDFVKKMKFNYPEYLDDGSIARALQLTSVPHNIILDGTGELLYNQEGLLEEEALSQILEEAMKNQKK